MGLGLLQDKFGAGSVGGCLGVVSSFSGGLKDHFPSPPPIGVLLGEIDGLVGG